MHSAAVTAQVSRQELYEKKHAEYESAIAEHNASASEKEMALFRVKSNLDVLALQRELDHDEGGRKRRGEKEREKGRPWASRNHSCIFVCFFSDKDWLKSVMTK